MKLFKIRRNGKEGEAQELPPGPAVGLEPPPGEPVAELPPGEPVAETPPLQDSDGSTGPAPEAPAPAAVPASHEDLFAQLGAEAMNEPAADQTDPLTGHPSAEDDALDPELLDIFRDAKSEVEESSLAAQLENVPIDELLSEAVGIGQRLGVKVDRQPGPSTERTPDGEPEDVSPAVTLAGEAEERSAVPAVEEPEPEPPAEDKSA